MKVLCLDLGTKLGFAIYDTSKAEVIFRGMELLEISDLRSHGSRFLKFRKWLTSTKNMVGTIDKVVYEDVNFHTSLAQSQLWGGWEAILTCWCEHHDIPYRAVPVSHVKIAATGKGNAKKDMIIDAMQKLGYAVHDDNEADALAIVQWVRQQR